ncbi:hypothetical protein TWF225_006164 [Orbilia oligospora]|nr:hypothetical protein TWF225_006164 [Orbilia oligospora]KAF3250801.1 hypothetical protein TWF217_008419 [Orbilia oligospora]
MMGLSSEAIIAIVAIVLGLPLLFIGIYQLYHQMRALRNQRRFAVASHNNPRVHSLGIDCGGGRYPILPLHTYHSSATHTQAYSHQVQTQTSVHLNSRFSAVRTESFRRDF